MIPARKTHFLSEHNWKEVLFDSGALAIFGLDLEGKCIFCNTTFLKMFGFVAEEEVIGKDVHSLIHYKRADGTPYPKEECIIQHCTKVIQCTHVEDEVFCRLDGTHIHAEYWSHPILKDGRPVGTTITMLNITERKRDQNRLEQAVRDLDAFVHTVSHDLRSPLTSVMGYIEVLKKKCCNRNATHCEVVDVLERESSRMASILEDLLALTQIGNLPRPSEPVDVRQEIEPIVELLKSQYPQISIRIQEDLSPPVYIPRTFLHQIFSNLLGNAARYGQAGDKPIEVGRKNSRGRIYFYVRDHGQGIPKEERISVFETFYRGSTGNGSPGTGIGLAIVQKIARYYNGHAWVEETPGGGATFWIELNTKKVGHYGRTEETTCGNRAEDPGPRNAAGCGSS